MPTNNPTEHFVTLFDYNFLPSGLALYDSLLTHALPFKLWVLCMDENVENKLRELELEHLKLISLTDVETEALLEAKKDRTGGEYCWTMTSFSPEAVMNIDPSIKRVTYLDADLFFFDNPSILLDEFEDSQADVLITEHACAPEYEKLSAEAGKYCVQFMTFNNTEAGKAILNWWQDRCVEWCYNRLEDGKFGDQRYLDDWPERFGSTVHVLEQKNKALAPWNISHYFDQEGGVSPVFYHFHGFRIVSTSKIKLFDGYSINTNVMSFYTIYSSLICEKLKVMNKLWNGFPVLPETWTIDSFLRNLRMKLYDHVRYKKIS